MNIWSAVIYGIAALFAVQALLALMTAHHRHSLRRYLDQESRRQPVEPAAAEKSQKAKAA
jgi:hypothetical protein